MAGDYNRVSIQEVLLSYGGLQQICGVPTRKGATLQLIVTDLHTYMHPPYALFPLQVDEGKAGKDSDHQALILAPKASKEFFLLKEKKEKLPHDQYQNLKLDLFVQNLSDVDWRVLTTLRI